MKLTNKYYGYPVLSPLSDDYQGIFQVTIDATIDEELETFIFKAIIQLDNDDLRALVQNYSAQFTIHLEESKTCFREIIVFSDFEHQFSIPFGKIRENVEVTAFITATKHIQGFNPQTVHPFYESVSIHYEPYQIIGVSEPKTIEVSKEIDEIKDSASIFSIISNKTELEKYIQIELTDERIVIVMPEMDFNIYNRLMRQNSLKNRHKDILLSNIVMPIMVEVLQLLKESQFLYDEKIWYKSLVKAYKEKNIDIIQAFSANTFSSYYYAQVIFDAVISKSLNQVEILAEERG
jgi:hypothetical protein